MIDVANASREEVVIALREAHAEVDRAEVKFMCLLFDVEKSRPDVWRTAGVTAFSQFLNSYSIVNYARYDAFRVGVKALGSTQKALEIGTDATIRAGKFEHKKDVAPFVKTTEAWIDSHDGAHPSAQTANEIGRSVDSSPHPAIHRSNELFELRAKVQKLEAEVRSKNRKIKALEDLIQKKDAKIEKLSATGQQKKKTRAKAA